MIVTVDGSAGLTKAYRSVLSAEGSPAMAGASRWLDARTPLADVTARRSEPAMAVARVRLDTMPLLVVSGADPLVSLPGCRRIHRRRAVRTFSDVVRCLYGRSQRTDEWLSRRARRAAGGRPRRRSRR